jgi:ABC-2 type transport system permease protein
LKTVAALTFRLILAGRLLAAGILLASIPLLLALLLLSVRAGFGLATLSAGAFYRLIVPGYFHTFVILASILFGTSAVGDDEEDGSVVYLVTRPVRRGVIYLGKTLAAAMATAIFVLPSLLATYIVLAVSAPSSPPRPLLLLEDLGWLSLASLAYPAAFAAVGALARRPLQLAAAYFFLWEVPMAFAPTALRYLTVSHYLMSLMPQLSPWHAVVANLGFSSPVPTALVGLAALVIALLALGSIRYERREHLPTAG